MMSLSLSRSDLIQGGVTSTNCMKLLPVVNRKEPNQKVVLGDQSGVMQCFSMKKRSPNHLFKTLPGVPISSLCLGGPLGGVKEKIFAAARAEVRGYTKKGKQFLTFSTSLSEPISSLYVEGSDLFVSGSFIFNHYLDLKDANFYYSSDQINDILCLPVSPGAGGESDGVTPVLACQDRALRVLKGRDVDFTVQVPGTPSVLSLFCNTGGEDHDEVLYGTSDGQIGLVQLSQLNPMHTWQIPNEKRAGGILCLDNYDITKDGILDLIVGRDDGTVEVYGYDESDEPVLRFSQCHNESVTAVHGGTVQSPDYDELVCSSYAGWVFSLTTEPPQKEVSQDGALKISAASAAKMEHLRTELEELQKRVFEERDRYQAACNDAGAVSAVTNFQVNSKFVLNREDASYTLGLEVPMPIDNVLVQCDVPIDLLDVEKNSAVVSYSECDASQGNYLLATYRCQANTTRLDLKVRTIEGQWGMLRAYVTPRVPPKTCQVIQCLIKPLSHHQRAHAFDNSRPLNELKLTGQFSAAEVHNWMTVCLPELPEKAPAGDTVEFVFQSSFLGTQLQCKYRRGEGVFKSDNISTISILKDVLTKEATKKGIRLDVSCQVSDDSVIHTLRLIHPRLEHQLLLAKKVQLIPGLKELSVSESSLAFMSPEYRGILEQSEFLLEEYKKQPCHLDRLYGTITDLFIDKYKFKGVNVKGKVPALLECLDTYNLQTLTNFFNAA